MQRRRFFTQALQSIKGSVLDSLAARLPQRDREDLALKWGYKQQQQQTAAAVAPRELVPDAEARLVVAAPPATVASPVEYEDIELLHPIFGELVVNLGYKRVYLTNVYSLAQAPIWEKNRILRPERARKIAAAKANDKLNPGSLSGVITCFMERGTRRHGIVDGQHRAASLVLLAAEGHWDEMKRNVLVDVFDVDGEPQIASLFKEINSGEPVKLVDMPDTDGASDMVRAILLQATESLAAEYPEMFKVSTRCRIPHLHADTLRDELFQTDFIARHKVTSAAELLMALHSANTSLGARSDDEWLSGPIAATENSLSKCRAHRFYLGLDKTWMRK